MAQRQPQIPQSKAEVLQIPDLKTAMLILKDMGVETKGKGIRNKDDAVNLIMENFDKGVSLPSKPVKVWFVLYLVPVKYEHIIFMGRLLGYKKDGLTPDDPCNNIVSYFSIQNYHFITKTCPCNKQRFFEL